MRNKIMINYNHIFRDSSLTNISKDCDFFLSSIHLKKDKINKILSNNKTIKRLYIDFMHYYSTDTYSNLLSPNILNKIHEKALDKIFIKENLVILKLEGKDNEIKSLVKQAISTWYQLIPHSNHCFALPLPILSNSDIYVDILKIYLDVYKELKIENNHNNMFCHLVFKNNSNLSQELLDLVNELLKYLKIEKIFISLWRQTDTLLTNINDLKNIDYIINHFYDKYTIFLNYFHNEFYYFSIKYKKINFVLGTFEQTKVLCPETMIFDDDTDGMKKMITKIFDQKLLINVKQNYISGLNQISDETRNQLATTRQESFKYNIETIYQTIMDLDINKLRISNQELLDIVNDKFCHDLFNRASKYNIEDYIKFNNLILSNDKS